MSEYNIFMTHVASKDLKDITSYIANELKEQLLPKKSLVK